jgi:hypothetical protein
MGKHGEFRHHPLEYRAGLQQVGMVVEDPLHVMARWHTCPEVGSPLVRHPVVWVDRQGRETPIPAPPREYVQPRLSPDGSRIALFVADQQFDNWVWSLAPGNTTLSRHTFDPNTDSTPVWTADGTRIAFTSEQGGVRNLL